MVISAGVIRISLLHPNFWYKSEQESFKNEYGGWGDDSVDKELATLATQGPEFDPQKPGWSSERL